MYVLRRITYFKAISYHALILSEKNKVGRSPLKGYFLFFCNGIIIPNVTSAKRDIAFKKEKATKAFTFMAFGGGCGILNLNLPLRANCELASQASPRRGYASHMSTKAHTPTKKQRIAKRLSVAFCEEPRKRCVSVGKNAKKVRNYELFRLMSRAIISK